MSDNQLAADVSKEKLIADFKVVVADAEELLKATAAQTGDKAAEVRAKINDSLQRAKIRLEEAEEAVVERTKAVARATDNYVHEHPWQAVGIAAGVGFLLGLLVGRR